MAPVVLLVGLPIDDPSIPPHVDRNLIKAGVEKTTADAVAAGYDIKVMYAGADEGVGNYAEELKRRKYDAVIIGFGVRGIPQLTVHFEEIVNMIVTVSPGTKMGFNASPDSTLAALARVAPV